MPRSRRGKTCRAATLPPVGRGPYRVRARDDTGTIDLVWFHQHADWVARSLPIGAVRIVSGKIAENHADALLDQALPSLRRRFAAVRTALAVAQSPEQIGEASSIVDPASTHVGIAVVARPVRPAAAAQAEEAPALYIVVMVARRAAPR